MDELGTAFDTTKAIIPPFPYYGGKRRVAHIIWRAFGHDIPNYVEPFAGSLSVLLGRPGGPGRSEIVNDLNCFIANFWRSVKYDIDTVIEYADNPVNAGDLCAINNWLFAQKNNLRKLIYASPLNYDARIAGWWVWGIGATNMGRFVACPKMDRMPNVFPAGIHGTEYDIHSQFRLLHQRLRRVVVDSGDWKRVLRNSVLSKAHTLLPCGIFLDPPYAHDGRDTEMYEHDSRGVFEDVCAWAVKNSDNPALRIAVCGYEGTYTFPSHWSVIEWKQPMRLWLHAGNKNGDRERIWLSPHCLPVNQQTSLWEDIA